MVNQLPPLVIQIAILVSTCINIVNFSLAITKYLSESQLAPQPAVTIQAEANQSK